MSDRNLSIDKFTAANGFINICFNDNRKAFEWFCAKLINQFEFYRSGHTTEGYDEVIYPDFSNGKLTILCGSDIWLGNYLLSTSMEADGLLKELYEMCVTKYRSEID